MTGIPLWFIPALWSFQYEAQRRVSHRHQAHQPREAAEVDDGEEEECEDHRLGDSLDTRPTWSRRTGREELTIRPPLGEAG